MVVVRWPGKTAEHLFFLELFAQLFLSREKVEKKLAIHTKLKDSPTYPLS
jgi:hypothetical protein